MTAGSAVACGVAQARGMHFTCLGEAPNLELPVPRKGPVFLGLQREDSPTLQLLFQGL